MAPFDDYHRTVIGYHGTGLATALRLVTRVEGFRPSQRAFDWLGHGIYFWEHAPQQALRFARIRQRQYQRKQVKSAEDLRRATEPLAVVGCMIRLGNCFDLLEPDNVEYLQDLFSDYKESMKLTGEVLPRNTRKYRKLDCDVFEYAYKIAKARNPGVEIESARGVYVPSGGERRVWAGSWISRDTHIQLCVRNPRNLLGLWLQNPPHLEVNDVHEAIRQPSDHHDPDHPSGEKGPSGDTAGAKT